MDRRAIDGIGLSAFPPALAGADDDRRKALMELVSPALVGGKELLTENVSESVLRVRTLLASAWENKFPGAVHVADFLHRLLYKTHINSDDFSAVQGRGGLTVGEALMTAMKDRVNRPVEAESIFAAASSALEWKLLYSGMYSHDGMKLKDGFKSASAISILTKDSYTWADFMSGMAAVAVKVDSQMAEHKNLREESPWGEVYAATVKVVHELGGVWPQNVYVPMLTAMRGINVALVGADDPKKTKTPDIVYDFYRRFIEANEDVLGVTLLQDDPQDKIQKTLGEIWSRLGNPTKSGVPKIHKGIKEYRLRKHEELNGDDLKLGAYHLFQVIRKVREGSA